VAHRRQKWKGGKQAKRIKIRLVGDATEVTPCCDLALGHFGGL